MTSFFVRCFQRRPRSVRWVAALAILGVGSIQHQMPRIEVGPNVLVSKDFDLTHWEYAIDAAPWDPAVLIAAGSAETHLGRQQAVYVSRDGGESWKGYLAGTLGDPMVAAGVTDGTLLFFGIDVRGKRNVVSRSLDGGTNWGPFQSLIYSDHPHVVVDRTDGKFRGSVYLTTLWCEKDQDYSKRVGWTLCLFRSRDEGKTWDPPIEFDHHDSTGRNTTGPLVLSDGTLVLPYADFDFSPRPGPKKRAAWVVVSNDGGQTFEPARKAYSMTVKPRGYVSEMPSFAVDPSPLHKDRLYLAWRDPSILNDRIFVISSDDRGLTWSRPAAVDPARRGRQYEPDIVVNKDGVVGVRWLDSRHGDSTVDWDEYFAASIDGGKTFLRSARVSSATSRGRRDERTWRADLDVFATSGGDSAVIWRSGRSGAGDYIGMTADAHGVFHPVWPDKRDGKTRMYTAAIAVRAGAARPADVRRVRVAGRLAPVDRRQFLVDYGQVRYDSAARVIEVPVRVRNLSSRPLGRPLVLTVNASHWQSGMESQPMTLMRHPLMRGSIVSGDSGATSASYDLSTLLVASELLPGEWTKPLVLKFNAEGSNALARLTFQLEAAP